MSSSATTVMRLDLKIGFIGGGQMALALAKGFMASGMVAPSKVLTSAPSDNNLMLWRQLGANTTHENADVIMGCDVIFLATKPHIFPAMMAGLEITGIEEDPKSKLQLENGEASNPENVISPNTRYITTDSKLFVSVMAGVTIKSLTNALSNIAFNPRVIRAHPNTPAMVGCGCAVYSLGESATTEDGDLIRNLFSSVGICDQVPEYQQDAFTGMAGSGPAYIYTIIEALSDGGVRMGLPRQMASKFAAQMTMGAAKMALESGKHTGQLKDEVTSPAGTTIRGIQVLERAGVRGAIMDAVQASAERAVELGKN